MPVGVLLVLPRRGNGLAVVAVLEHAPIVKAEAAGTADGSNVPRPAQYASSNHSVAL
jgi:hypothetical protein